MPRRHDDLFGGIANFSALHDRNLRDAVLGLYYSHKFAACAIEEIGRVVDGC